MTRTRGLGFLMVCILFAGCSSMELSPEEKAFRERAKALPVASSITVTELQRYQEIGPLDCEENLTFQNESEGDESCRDTLKIDGARRGADLIVVESRDRACRFMKENCVHMHARAYKSKTAPGA